MKGREESVAAIICAAGSSNRMGGAKKEYLPFPENDIPSKKSPAKKQLSVLGAAVKAFASCPGIYPIVIVLPEREKRADRARFSGVILEELRLIDPYCNPASSGSEEQGRILFVSGGPTRRASVHNALSFLAQYSPSYVLIHDGARPWIKKPLIQKIINAAKQYGAVIPALPLTETPKELSGPLVSGGRPLLDGPGNYIKRHLKRAELCTAQTPQGFKFSGILAAHEKAARKEKREPAFEYTDDAEVWAEFIGKVAVISGDAANRKITYPEDLRLR